MSDRSQTDFVPLSSDWTADEVRRACPMIRVDALLPGDVLLTKGAGLEAEGIAAAPSKGVAASSRLRFSHAGIWLPMCDDDMSWGFPLHLVESDDHGVGPSLPDFALIALDGGSTRRTLHHRLPAGTVKAMVLRHPGMGSVPGEVLSSAVRELEASEFWKAYSSLSRLRYAVDVHPLLREMVGLALGILDTADPKLIAGAFCSELVAKFFGLIGLDLFEDGRAPETISPNLLASPSCALCEVREAVLDAEGVKDDASGCLFETSMPALSRHTLLPLLVRDRSTASRLGTLATEFAKLVHDDFAATPQRMARTIDALLVENALALRQTAAIGDVSAGRRLEIVGHRLRKASAMIDLVQEDLRGEGDDQETVAAQGCACYVASVMMTAAAHDGLRTTTLAATRLLRRSGPALGTLARIRLRFKRRNLLRSWPDSVRDQRVMVDVLRWMRPRDQALAELADALIAKTEHGAGCAAGRA